MRLGKLRGSPVIFRTIALSVGLKLTDIEPEPEDRRPPKVEQSLFQNHIGSISPFPFVCITDYYPAILNSPLLINVPDIAYFISPNIWSNSLSIASREQD